MAHCLRGTDSVQRVHFQTAPDKVDAIRRNPFRQGVEELHDILPNFFFVHPVELCVVMVRCQKHQCNNPEGPDIDS
jgi:hypothetical protein